MTMFAEGAASATSRPKILLVEDDTAVRRSLQLLLSGRGFDVRSYASSNALLADSVNRDAVCVVADYRMPELDGLGVLHSLRREGWAGAAVLITAYNSPHVLARAKAEGFDAILEKPLRGTAVADTVFRLLAEAGQADQREA